MTIQSDKFIFYISKNGKDLDGEFDRFDKVSITNQYEILYNFSANYSKCKNKYIDNHYILIIKIVQDLKVINLFLIIIKSNNIFKKEIYRYLIVIISNLSLINGYLSLIAEEVDKKNNPSTFQY